MSVSSSASVSQLNQLKEILNQNQGSTSARMNGGKKRGYRSRSRKHTKKCGGNKLHMGGRHKKHHRSKRHKKHH